MVMHVVAVGGGFCVLFQAEDGIRDLVRSRGLGDVYKRQIILLLINAFCPDLPDPSVTQQRMLYRDDKAHS